MLVFITSNGPAVIKICSILEGVVIQTEINAELRFGNIQKYISNLLYSSYRFYN